MAKLQAIDPALMAELTWAGLYTESMRRDLRAISAALRKAKSTSVGSQMLAGAALLRVQLKLANRTVLSLSHSAGV